MVDVLQGKNETEQLSEDKWLLDVKITARDEIVSMSRSRSLKIYNMTTSDLVRKRFYSLSDTYNQLVLSTDGTKAVCTRELTDNVSVFNIHEDNYRPSVASIDRHMEGHFVRVSSRDGFVIAAVGLGGILRLYDIKRPENEDDRATKSFSGTSYCVAYAPDQRHVVTKHVSTIYVWDVLTGEKVRAIQGI